LAGAETRIMDAAENSPPEVDWKILYEKSLADHSITKRKLEQAQGKNFNCV